MIGLFSTIDSQINLKRLEHNFLRNHVGVIALATQLEQKIKDVKAKECRYFYKDLEDYLTVEKIVPEQFMSKMWEEYFLSRNI